VDEVVALTSELIAACAAALAVGVVSSLCD
jgi:hypothetical protein